MKTDIWMPIVIGDYLSDTMHLKAEGHGIYLLFMFHSWKKKCELPKDIEELKSIARTEDESLIIKILNEFFEETSNGYTQSRLEKERLKAEKNRETARKNGQNGGRPRKEKTQKKPMGFNKETQNKPGGYENNNPNLTQEETDGFLKRNPEKTSSPSPSPIVFSNDNTMKEKDKKENFPIPKYIHPESENVIDLSEEIGNESRKYIPPKKPKKRFSPDLSFIESKDWRDLFKLWVKSKSKPFTKQVGVETGFKYLQNISANNLETAKKIVDKSIANNYAGLFPIDNSSDQVPVSSQVKDYREGWDDFMGNGK